MYCFAYTTRFFSVVGALTQCPGFQQVMSDRFTDASASKTRLISAIPGDSRSHYLAGAGFVDLTGRAPLSVLAIR